MIHYDNAQKPARSTRCSLCGAEYTGTHFCPNHSGPQWATWQVSGVPAFPDLARIAAALERIAAALEEKG